jgi:Transposase DDE domain group 1
MRPRRWSFLREFAFGHVRQLDAVAARLLARLHARTPLLAGIDGPVLVDLDDTIIEVHGYAKQGSEYGYSGVRGLNALIATVTTEHAASVITGQRLRKGACGSARGAARMVADTLAAVARLRSPESTAKPLVRADSAFYGYPTVAAAMRGGADVSITVRLDPKVKASIADIPGDAWTAIEYADALYDETTHQWISRAEVAEIGFTAFSSRKATE